HLISNGAGKNFSITIGANAEAAGIEQVNATGVTGNLTLTATAYDAELIVRTGAGDHDVIHLGTGDDSVRYATGTSVLDATDIVDGGSGSDTMRFTGDTTLTDAQFTTVTSFERLDLRDGTFHVTLGANADAAGIVKIDASNGDGSPLTLDAHGMANGLTVF